MVVLRSVRSFFCLIKGDSKILIEQIQEILDDYDKKIDNLQSGTPSNSLYNKVVPYDYLSNFLKKFYSVFMYFEISNSGLDSLKIITAKLDESHRKLDVENYRAIMHDIIEFLKLFEILIFQKTNQLTCEEGIRLDEAIDCFNNCCFLSTIVLSATAVESRLYDIFRKENETLCKKLEEDRPITLGTLIGIFGESKKFNTQEYDSFKKMIPDEHKPLLSLLNYYRICSSHPKENKINRNIASAILSLTFTFLLDENLSIISS